MQEHRLGKYRHLELIARGNQGTVYSAFDPVERKVVALKELLPGLVREPGYIDRFEREARLAASVDHPNVVKIFDVGHEGDSHYITLEFLPDSLAEWIDTGLHPIELTAEISAAIADGTGAVHRLEITHRDLKPHNILMDADGNPKVTDFGIARAEFLSDMTLPGSIMGTPNYMSPEQARGFQADYRSDVYSLGCVLFEMLTGQPPFSAATPHEVARKHIEEQMRPVRSVRYDVPEALARVLERATHKTPEQRYANGDDMAKALRSAIESMQARVQRATPPLRTASDTFDDLTPAPHDLDASKLPRETVDTSTSTSTDESESVKDDEPVVPVSPASPISKAGTPDPGVEPPVRPTTERVAQTPPVSPTPPKPPEPPMPPADYKLIVNPPEPPEPIQRSVWWFWMTAAVIAGIVFAWFNCLIPFGCPESPGEEVKVVHWATGHLFFDDGLADMAEKFNEAGFETDSGKRIVVQTINKPSSDQAEDLLSRVTTGVKLAARCCPAQSEPHPDPTIVTPSSEHWLMNVNLGAGRSVVDPDAAKSIARAYIGIVTYREMAECLGWPQKEIGFADIIALRDNPQGWNAYECADPDWGKTPLVAFTDPTNSSTGRSVLLALYSIAANKSPEQLTLSDVDDAQVVGFVEKFAGLVDHYLIGTTVLNTKIHQGPQFGHFFLMPEDNLIHLKEGTVSAFINGEKVTAPPIDRPMVMIYPKEGSLTRNNCACIVDASWVSPDERNAAEKWIAFLRESEQQADFMNAGFRPAIQMAIRSPISVEFGLDPREPAKQIDLGSMDPVVAKAIDDAWYQVKRPGIVTIVVDASGSMAGEKIQQVKDGITRAMDAIAPNNQIGLVKFEDSVTTLVKVGPISSTRPLITSALQRLRPNGGTALYNAIKVGILMTDAAAGDADSIRAVVVLTDGQANEGRTEVDDLVEMRAANGVPVTRFTGFSQTGTLRGGASISVEEIIGYEQLIETRNPVQIFFLGIGEEADLQIGRILAEATSAEFQGVSESDLADVLEDYINYF